MTAPSHQMYRIDELDGLRGLLAIWVAVTHILCLSGFARLPFGAIGPIGRFWDQFIFAQPAVETFIILSGFVITLLLRNGGPSWGQFMAGRVFRIYPVYLVCLTLGLGAAAATPFLLHSAAWRDNIYFEWMRERSAIETTRPLPHLLWHLTLLFGVIPHKLLPEATGTFLPPAWSISLEWQYYLLAPFIAFWVRTRKGLLALGVFGCAGVWYSRYWQNPHCAFFPAQLPLFLIGIGSFHLYERLRQWPKGGWSGASYVVTAAVAAAILLQWHWVAVILWALVFGSLFAAGEDLLSQSLRSLRRLLLHPWLQSLGKISYPLYLVHWPILIFLLAVLLRWMPAITRIEAVLVMLLAGSAFVLGSAWLLHKLVEKPLMRAGKRVIQGMAPRRVADAVPTTPVSAT